MEKIIEYNNQIKEKIIEIKLIENEACKYINNLDKPNSLLEAIVILSSVSPVDLLDTCCNDPANMVDPFYVKIDLEKRKWFENASEADIIVTMRSNPKYFKEDNGMFFSKISEM